MQWVDLAPQSVPSIWAVVADVREDKVVASLTRCLRITPRSNKASHHEFELLDAGVKVFILERDCTLAAVTNELCMIAKPSKGSRMLVPAVDTDNRDRRVIKACFPHWRDPIS